MIRIGSSESAVAKHRWSHGVRTLLALALLVTGLSVTELAQAEGFNDFQWSLGEDCAVPLGEDNPDGDGSYQRGDTND